MISKKPQNGQKTFECFSFFRNFGVQAQFLFYIYAFFIQSTLTGLLNLVHQIPKFEFREFFASSDTPGDPRGV